MDELATQEKGFDMRPMMGGMMAIVMLIAAVGLVGATTPQPQPGLYGCPYCDASFDTLAELIEHVNTVHPDKPPIQETTIEWD